MSALPASGTVGRGWDYLAVGHVTVDVIEDRPIGPESQPGGGAFYSALQAALLGLNALIVTRGVPHEIEELLAPCLGEHKGGGRLEVVVEPAQATTRLATTGKGSGRRQRLTSWAGPMELLPDLACAIAHLAPVARETPRMSMTPLAPTLDGASFVALTPQGLVRGWGEDGAITPAPLDPDFLPSHLDAAVFSRAEREPCSVLLEDDGPAKGALVAMTAGAAPIELRLPNGETLAVETVEVEDACDDLGAGDVFAAALFIKLWQGEPAASAAAYASAAAAVRMEGLGPWSVGDASAVKARHASAGQAG